MLKKGAALILLPMILGLLSSSAGLFSSAAAEKAQRKLTIMVYLCGSNLESDYGSASADLEEMKAATFDAGQVSLLVMAGGSTTWKAGYDTGKTHILEVAHNRSRIVWSDELLNMGSPDSLRRFLAFSRENYPADEYAMIFWDHGGGPLEGVCWDELFSLDSLSLKELTGALKDADFPEKLKWIGFDACLMSSTEVAAAVAPYAEYMIASQETEPAFGWNYAFLNGIEQDESGAETGRRIVDSYFEQSAGQAASQTLTCVDLSGIESIREEMDRFFSPIGQEVSPDSFSRLADLRLSVAGFGKAGGDSQSHGYDLVDLQDLVSRYSRNTSGDRVLEAVRDAIVYTRSNVDGSTGLSIYHPYDNKQRYLERWQEDYESLSICDGYTEYIERFGTILTGNTLADWSGLTTETLPRDSAGHLYTLQLTPDQRETFASAQLVILAARDLRNGVYGTQYTSMEDADKGDTVYSPIYVSEAAVDENGLLSAVYDGQAIYATDDRGVPVLGPLAYEMSEDGSVFFIHGLYQDKSGRKDFVRDLSVIFDVVPSGGSELTVSGVRGYDPVTKTYSNRIPVDESVYTDLQFYPLTREMPSSLNELPGFESWQNHNTLNTEDGSIRLPISWQFRLFPDQLSASQLYAAIQVTDSQRGTHMGKPVAIENPNLEKVQITPECILTEDCQIKISFIRDHSPLSPGLNLIVEATNLSRWTENIILDHILINHSQEAAPILPTPVYVYKLPPHETKVEILHMDQSALTGLTEITSLTAEMSLQQLHHRNEESTVSFEIDHLDLSGIAPPAAEPLAVTDTGGMEWQLCSLEEDRHGGLTGLLRVTNRSGSLLEGFASLAVNGLMIDGSDYLYINSAPGSTAYYPFTLSSSALLKAPLMMNGRTHWYWMSTENTYARYGVEEIRDLQILVSSGYTLAADVTLTLSEPRPLSGASQPSSSAGPQLMTGKLEAWAEQVLLAENGIGLRLVFENHGDHSATVTIGHRRLNQRMQQNPSPYLTVPAGGRTVYVFSVYDDELAESGEALKEIGFCFRVDDRFATRDICLRLPAGAVPGYLPAEDCSADPVEYDPPELVLSSPEQRIPDVCDLGMSCSLTNGDSIIGLGDIYNTARNTLRLELWLTNLAETEMNFSSSNMIVNGTRVISGKWTFYQTAPGGTKTGNLSIDLAQLRGIPEIRDFRFDLTWYPKDDYRNKKTETVIFAVEKGDISALIPDVPSPLSEGSDGEVSWELCGISWGTQERIDLLLHARNIGGSPLPTHKMGVAVNGVSAADFFLDEFQPGTDLWLTVSVPNEMQIYSGTLEVYQYPYEEGKLYYPMETNLLEHRGAAAVSEITLFNTRKLQTAGAGDDGRLTLSLKDPFPLDASAVYAEPVHPMTKDKLMLYPAAMLIGNNGVALSLDICNDTEETISLKATEVKINGRPCEIYQGQYHTVSVYPHTSRTDCFVFRTDDQPEAFPAGQLIRDVVLSLETESYTFKGVLALAREAPLGAAGGVLVQSNEIYENVSRASMLLTGAPTLKSETLKRVRLAPPLEAEQVSRFQSGTASLWSDRPDPVLYQDPDHPDAEPEYLPARIRLVQAEMELDQNGVLAADIPGVLWVTAQRDPLEYYSITPSDGEEGDYILAMSLALFSDPEIPLNLPWEIPLDDTDYEYSELAAFLIQIGEDGRAEQGGFLLEAYNRQDEEVTQQVIQEETIQIGAADRKGLTTPEGQNQTVFYDHFPVLSFESMEFIPLEEWQLPLYVYYEITFTDGSSAAFWVPYSG